MITVRIEEARVLLEAEKTVKARNAYPDLDKVCEAANQLFDLLSSEGLMSAFSEHGSNALAGQVQKIEERIGLYLRELNSERCVEVNRAIGICYELLLSETSNIRGVLAKKIASLGADVDGLAENCRERGEQANHFLESVRSARDSARTTREQLEKLLHEAKNRVNTFAEKEVGTRERLMDALSKKFDNELGAHKKTWEGRFGELEARRIEFIDILDTTKRYFKESRFDDYARSETKSADRFRLLSLLLMILVASVVLGLTGVAVFQWAPPADSALDNIAGRYLLVFSLMIPAIYASREATRHRTNAERYSQMACELAAFEVVLQDEDMPKEMKYAIKADIIKRYFGSMTVFSREDMLDVIKVSPWKREKDTKAEGGPKAKATK